MPICCQCNNNVSEKYCPNCGQAAQLQRIDKHYISHELLHLFHFEKGFSYTAKELFLRPGNSIRGFIAVNRNKHMKPIPYLIVTSLLYTLITHFIKADEINNGKEKLDFDNKTIDAMLYWVQHHFGYANIMMGIFIALAIYFIFKKYNYNFFEVLILTTFIMGQGMLLITIVSCFVHVLDFKIYMFIFSVTSLAYPAWVIGQFFDGNKIGSYVKGLSSYFIGYVLFYFVLILIGFVLDIIFKMV